jgi:hypothetical protein
MTDNLTLRKIDGVWTVLTVLTRRIKFQGTKKECEDYMENN